MAGRAVGILVLFTLFCFASAITLNPEDTQVVLNTHKEAEAHLPSPLHVTTLADGDKEVTLRAVNPLEIEPQGTVGGLKRASETTFMICQMFDISDIPPTHITKFQPHISKQDDAPDDHTVVHHIDIFMCGKSVDKNRFSRYGGRCDSFPEDSSSDGCWSYAYAYDRGAGAVTFPDKYGVRIGYDTPFATIVMQRHLLISPQMSQPFFEDSHVTMTTTTKLREYNLGVSGVLDFALYIPPRKPAFTYTYTCDQNRVNSGFDLETPAINRTGVWPVVVHMHMHNRGKRMRFDVVRDGAVRKTVWNDDNYGGYGPSENWHTVPEWTTEEAIRAGDSLRVSCTFDTANKAIATRYGIDWGDEMCGPLYYFAPFDPNSAYQHKAGFACQGDYRNEATNS